MKTTLANIFYRPSPYKTIRTKALDLNRGDEIRISKSLIIAHIYGTIIYVIRKYFCVIDDFFVNMCFVNTF